MFDLKPTPNFNLKQKYWRSLIFSVSFNIWIVCEISSVKASSPTWTFCQVALRLGSKGIYNLVH